jgi:hypothetical protein
MSTSVQFEQKIARIHELLEGQEANVQWNAKIPDPDTPKQKRQIDVLIRKGEFFIIIECRIRKKKQDVMWIEGLIGRRKSLNADGAIAVSASGFTVPAIKKASSHGILLNDLSTLSDEEIISWAKSINITLFFYCYKKLEISLYLNKNDAHAVKQELLITELRNSNHLQAMFNKVHELIDSQKLIAMENRNKIINFNVQMVIDNFKVQDKTVIKAAIKGKASLEKIDLSIPLTLAYGNPEYNTNERNIIIQEYNLGNTSIIHNSNKISICLDLSKLETPPFWQFRFFETRGTGEYLHEILEIINPDKVNMIGKLNINIYLTDPK